MRRLIYICSPYSDNPKEHTKAARSYCRKVYECGYIPLAPHLHFPQFLDDSKPKERRDGLQMATELLRRCNSLLICGDRISEGMMMEIQLAKQLGMMVTTLDGFLIAQKMRQQTAPTI